MHFPSSVDFAILKNKITAMRKSTGTQSEGLPEEAISTNFIDRKSKIFVWDHSFSTFANSQNLPKN